MSAEVIGASSVQCAKGKKRREALCEHPLCAKYLIMFNSGDEVQKGG